MDDRGSGPAGRTGALLGGVVLLSMGGVLVAVGAVLTVGAAITATRRWVSTWQQPPRAVARQRWSQARSAAASGSRGWREAATASPTSPVGHG